MSSCCETVVISDDDLVLVSTPTSDLVVITDGDEIVVVDSDIDVVVIDQSEIVVVDDSVGPAGPPGPPGLGFTIVAEASETIQALRAVSLDNVGKAYLPDPLTLQETEEIFGISLSAALVGENLNIQTYGLLITAPLWTPGPLYLGPGGMLVSSVPLVGNCLQVAVAISATAIIIRPLFPVVLI